MRKVLSFVLVLAMILGSVSMVFAASFTDTKGKDYEAAASLLNDLGVINGYSATEFGGEKNITRAEYVAMVVKALGFDVKGSAETGYKDVPAGYWASAAIKYAKDLGIVAGYTDGSFKPKANVTLDEAIAFTVRALGYKAEYLIGSYPTSYINVAIANNMLEGLTTGSVAATRGDIATLLYNTLTVPTIVYIDKNGNTSASPSMLSRLGAKQVKTNAGKAYYQIVDQAVLDGCADGLNLTEYLGAYVNLYVGTKGASEGKYIGVYDVKSQFITGTYNAGVGTAKPTIKLADGTKYTLDAPTYDHVALNDATSTPSYVPFKNGKAGVVTLANGKDYTFAVKLSGSHITDLYSVSQWVADDEFKFSADKLNTKKATLNGSNAFTVDKFDAIDTTSFELVGVNALDDIKEKDVVTVYLGGSPAKITKVAVSNKVVEGTVDKIDGTKFTIAGTEYKMSPKAVDAAPIIKTEGKFFINAAGQIHAYDTTTKAAYAIVLDAGDANGTGLNAVTAKVELFLADGTTKTFDVPTTAVLTKANGTTNAAIEAVVAAGDLVEYTLTTKGKIAKLTVLNGYTPSTKKITAQKTVDGTLVSDKAVLFTYNGGDNDDAASYGVVELSALLGVEFNTARFIAGTDGAYKAAFITKPSTANDTYALYVKAAEINDASYTNLFTMLVGVDSVEYKTNEAALTAGKLYKLSIDANGGLAKADEFTTVLTEVDRRVSASVTTGASVSSNNRVVTIDGTVVKTLAENVVVYVWNGTKFEVGTISDLKEVAAGKSVVLYDTDKTQDKVYDVVVIQ